MESDHSGQGSPPPFDPSFKSRWQLHLTSHWNVAQQIKRVKNKLMNKNLPITEEVRKTINDTIDAMFTDDMDACIRVLNDLEDTIYVLEKNPGVYEMDSILDVLQSKFDYADSMKEKMKQINEGLKAIPEYEEVQTFDTHVEQTNNHLAQDETYLSKEFTILNEHIVLVSLDHCVAELTNLKEFMLKMKFEMDVVVGKTLDTIEKNKAKIDIIKAFLQTKI